ARFRYRAYSILSESDLEKLRKVLKSYENTPIPSEEEYGYHGHFIDKRNGKKFFIDFEKQIDSTYQPTQKISNVYSFLDDSIKWNATYGN
ncbi:MAG: hypothetical protein AAF696_34455, partial [Bacteroidota bacterium]